MITNNKTERVTSQKKLILDYLKSVDVHPSAEKVFREVRKKLPQISKGTVYRILNNLGENQKIMEIPWEVGRYDGNVSFHAHFFCEECKMIFDIFDISEKCGFLKNNGIKKVGKIKSHQINFYGICKHCQKK